MPGYNIEGIIFHQPELREKYMCPKCNLLLRDTVQASCGHWLCKSCADIIASENDPCCPRDNCEEQFAPDDDYFPDRFVRKDILNLLIHCKYSHMGCDWEGKFGDLEEHLTEKCAHNSTKCEFCHKTIRYDELDTHKTECPMAPKECPLSEIGCLSAKLAPQELKEHLDVNSYNHMKILASRLLTLEMKIKKVERPTDTEFADPNDQGHGLLELKIVEDDDTMLVDPNDQGHGLIRCTIGSMYDFAKRFISRNKVTNSVAKSVPESTANGMETSNLDHFIFPDAPTRRAQRTLDGDLDEIKSEVAEFKNDLNLNLFKELEARDEEIAGLKSAVSKLEKLVHSKNADFGQNHNHDGSMVWKIPQFSQRMNDAKSGKYTSIFSLPFYTGHYGYKMCLRLYILGDGIGKGSYMSLFFVLIKGEFDNILQWPFTHKVTFKLINQNGGGDVVDTLQPDPTSSSFQRPKSDIMNIASGCPRFVTHANLSSGDFIADDTIYIKCIIDTTIEDQDFLIV